MQLRSSRKTILKAGNRKKNTKYEKKKQNSVNNGRNKPMNIAKISTKGQITLYIDVRRKLAIRRMKFSIV